MLGADNRQDMDETSARALPAIRNYRPKNQGFPLP